MVETNSNGAGPYKEIESNIVGFFGAANVKLAPLQLVNGFYTAVWEVIDSDPFTREQIRFGIVGVAENLPSSVSLLDIAQLSSGDLVPVAVSDDPLAGASFPRFVSLPTTPVYCFEISCVSASFPVIDVPVGSGTGTAEITVSDNGQPTPFVVLSLGQPWLRISAFGGITPATLTITADATGLAAGSYRGEVLIQTNITMLTSIVTVRVNDPANPPIPPFQITPERITLQVIQGDSSPAPQQLRLNGRAGLSFSANSNDNWLKVSPASGTLPATLSVSIDSANLAVGEYLGTIVANSPGTNPVTVAIRLTMIEPPQLLPQ